MREITRNFDDLGRRQFIAQAAKACLGVGLLPMLGDHVNTPLNALTPGVRPATARYVIYLNMAGGMTHLDTFDPKPNNPKIQGPTKAVQTSADGVILSENFAKTAAHMHNAAVIRSVSTNQGAHEQAGYLMHTSYVKRGTIVHPTFGSWVAKMSGQINRTIPMNVRIG
ncbi:MAG: DUF1501 domain-containing protein, partial [Opitutales bacterium]|nr:DUF1501 domain-containing protein [Opitutales bacterium]